MLDRILSFSVTNRALVVLLTLAAAAVGGLALLRLPIDAVPDITNRQVQINAAAPSLSPLEVETQVTFVLETALAGIPGLDYTRSLSRNGFAQVTAVFRDDVDIYFARQQVTERLSAARNELPSDVETQMGPIATGLGEIYMWTVAYAHPHGHGAAVADGRPGWQSDGSYLTPEGQRLATELERAAYLRTVQDWIISPQMRGVEGIAAIDPVGGDVKQYHVQPDPRLLAAYDITLPALVTALERNNTSLGAGFVEHNGASYVVRAPGRLTDPAQLGDVLVAERGGTPVHVHDVATIVVGAELRTGSATENGEEVVLGTAIMLLGSNSRTVSAAADARLAEVANSLPPDVRVRTVLDRTTLIDATIRTVVTNLAEGALLVVVVLFLLLGNLRAAVITALAIPLSMLLTAIGMVATHTSGNLMSLGAIDFGLIVDGAVIIVENCLRRLAERQQALGRVLSEPERLAVVRDASHQVRSATAFGEAIIIIVYVPILFLTGVEGRMFRPMATTVIFALIAAFILSLTFVPAMVALCIRGRIRERENPLIALAQRLYAPAVRWAVAWRVPLLIAALALSGAALGLFSRLGQEFAPTLGELDLLVQCYRVPSVSVREATAMQRQIENTLTDMPEVLLAFSRTGTAEIAFDPMPPYMSDLYVMLRPRSQWPNPAETKDEVAARVAARLATVPGALYAVSQPIEERFGELLAGVRGDVAVKVFGDDFDALLPVARRIAGVLRGVRGAADVTVEPVSGAPVLQIVVDRTAIGRYGLTVADVQEVVAVAVGGRPAGVIFEGDRRFEVVVRLPEHLREDIAALERLPIALSHQDEPATSLTLGGDDLHRAALRFVPLDAVADIQLTEGPNQISRDNGKRRIVVQANVHGRDIGSFVEEAQRRIASEVAVPAGSWLTWGGQYENLVQAKQRLAVVVPICFAVILLLLYGTFRSWPAAAVVFSGVPLALSGGVVALWLRDIPFSISAAVGFIALSGVAVLNGLVMITFINQLRATGIPTPDAIARGAVTRLRPVLITALVASLGFLPMALATGTGAEVQRPLATVVIGGLATSTLLTLFVLPALYSLLARRIKTAG